MKTLLAFEFVGAVACADRSRERIATRSFYELDRFLRICERGMAFVHLNILFDTTELSEFSFDADAFCVRAIHDAFCDGDVFFERLVAGIDHDRAIKA